MHFELPPLPYAKNALEPFMSRETIDYHYEKHHRGYLTKLQAAIAGTPDEARSLEDVIRGSSGSVFNNAAQVWNHTFFWSCMEPRGGGEPGGDLGHRLRDAFGSFAAFREAFLSTGTGCFGSGYVWLVADREGALRVVATANADNPLTKRDVPLLGCDVWEHAYYLDYRNARGRFLETFLDRLARWDRVGELLRASA
ncbi:MAG: superoxide dismutase [Deltaproteobacteria bacterium]|nr:superoxide dismutase [Deltaproteobacteria bacterium]